MLEPVELFTILEKAKVEKLYAIAEQGTAGNWNEVLCEERAYEALSELTKDVLALAGDDMKPLYEAVTELVIKEKSMDLAKEIHTNPSSLPTDVRDELDAKLKEGLLDVDTVCTFPRKNQNL